MSLKIRLTIVIDCLAFITIFLFSAHDCIVRLYPNLPYKVLELVSLIALIFLVLVSKNRLNQRMILFLLMFYLIVVFNILLGTNTQSDYIKSLFLNISSTSKLWVYLIVFSLINDKNKWCRMLLYFAYINMTLLVITTMNGMYSGAGREVNYLGIGITGAMWIPIIIQGAFKTDSKKRLVNVIASIVFSVFSIVYGNRGSILAIAAFLVFCIIHYTKLKRKIALILGISALAWLYVEFQDVINVLIIDAVNKLGINSRNLTLMLNNQITYSTHRMDEIWVYVFDAIKENWWIGYGLCYDRVLSGDLSIYAHNLVLEVWLSFGLIIGTFILIAYFGSGLKLCFSKDDPDWSGLFAPFFISSTVLLMFNNSFCQLGFFWASLGVYLAYQKEKSKRKRKTYYSGGYSL